MKRIRIVPSVPNPDSGNIKQNPSTPTKETTRQCSPKIRWTFTKFINWDDSSTVPEILEFENSLKKICKFFIYGKEYTPSTNRPHLQGYMELTKKMRPTQIVKFAHLNMALFPSNGNREHNEIYCGKEGRGYTEWHKPKKNPSDIIRKNIPDVSTAVRVLCEWGAKPNSILKFTPELLSIIVDSTIKCGEDPYNILIGYLHTELDSRDAGSNLLKEYRA